MKFVLALLLIISSMSAQASEACRETLSPTLKLRFAKDRSSIEGMETYLAIDALKNTLGKITIRLKANDSRLDILGVKVEDKALRRGVAEFLIREVLDRNPDVVEVEAEYVMTNAAIVTLERAKGYPLETALLAAPTSRTLLKLGFTELRSASEEDHLYYIVLARP